jgi:carboxymethylenebutenolidase
MIWFKRIGLIALGTLALLIAVIGSVMVYDLNAGPQTADNSNTRYISGDGLEQLGYLVAPEEPGRYPAVLLLHEWWGLNAEMTVLADALAAEGYVVFAPDVYRGRLATTVPGALYLRLGTPGEQVSAAVDAALAHLRSLENVDPSRVAALGFCFGGGNALQLALRQPQNLAGTIIYYGSVETEIEAVRPLANQHPILGIFGEADSSIPVTNVRAFEAALNSLNIANEIVIYPGEGHAFLNEHNYNQPGTAAADAWQRTLTFLAESLAER